MSVSNIMSKYRGGGKRKVIGEKVSVKKEKMGKWLVSWDEDGLRVEVVR